MSDLWPTVAAGEVARIEIGGTPSRDDLTLWSDSDHGYPWASIADLRAGTVTTTAEYISERGVRSSNVKLVPAGTPIMSFKLTIGRTARAGCDLYTNEAIAAFYCDTAVLDPDYMYYVLPRAASAVITDVAIKGATLNKKSLAGMRLPLPALSEQKVIADVLQVADQQLAATQLVLSKLRTLRSGMLRELIQLAASAVSGATAGNLGDFVDCFSGGTPLKDASQFWNGPIPWVTPKDMKALVLAGTADTLTARGVTAGSRLAPRGASFIVVRGMILAHSFPVSILPDRAAFNQDVKALVARSGLQQDYLTFWLVAHCDEMLRRVGEQHTARRNWTFET